MHSLAPFGSGTILFRKRLEASDLNALEVELMRRWEAVNRQGTDSPIVRIAAEIFRQDNHQQPMLPRAFWCGFIDPRLIGMISSAVQWTGTNVGRCDYDGMARARVTEAWAIRHYLGKHFGSGVLHGVLHECNAACGTRQLDPRLGWHTGCHVVSVPQPLPRVFFCTLEWLLTEEGKTWRAAGVAAWMADEPARRARASEAHRQRQAAAYGQAA